MISFEKVNNIPGVDRVFRFENLYISSQPSNETLEWVRDQSINKVINLRDLDEMDFEFERNFCEKNQIDYHQFPITCNGNFITENLKKLNQLIENKSENYFIHCGSANRVIAWLLTYLPSHKNISFIDSEKMVREMGLTNDNFIDQARNISLV